MSTSFIWKDLGQDVEAIELPALLKDGDMDKGFDLLGGREQTINQLELRSTSLKFNYPGEGRIKNALEGNVGDTLGLLLRIKKPVKGHGKNDARPSTLEPVGRVFKSHRFTQPSDFQFLPQRTYEVESDRVELAVKLLKKLCPPPGGKEGLVRAEDSGRRMIWDARPSRFMHKDKSTTTAHATGLFNSKIVVEAPNEARKRIKSVAYVLNAGDPIPTAPKEKHEIKRSSRKESDYTHNEVIAMYKELLDVRPLWSKKVLDGHIMFRDKGQRHFVKTMLPYFSYYWASGPMKDLWSKFGYDPAQLKESRFYQMINVRINKADWAVLKSKLAKVVGESTTLTHACNLETGLMESLNGQPLEALSTTGRVDLDSSSVPIVMFDTLVKQQFAVQVCNCTDSDMVEFIGKASCLPEWDKVTGWFTENALKLFRQRILQRLTEKLDAFISKPIQYSTRVCPLVDCDKPKSAEAFKQDAKEWQSKYLALDTVVSESKEELFENDRMLNSLLGGPWQVRLSYKAAQPPTLATNTSIAAAEKVTASSSSSSSSSATVTRGPASMSTAPPPKTKTASTELGGGVGKRKAPAAVRDYGGEKKAKMRTEAVKSGTFDLLKVDEHLENPNEPMDSRLMQQVHASQGFFTAADLPDSDSDTDSQ